MVPTLTRAIQPHGAANPTRTGPGEELPPGNNPSAPGEGGTPREPGKRGGWSPDLRCLLPGRRRRVGPGPGPGGSPPRGGGGGGRKGRLGCALRGCGGCREARVPHVAGSGVGPQLRRASVMRPWLFGARIIVRLSGLLAGDQGLTSRTSGLGGQLLPDSDRGRGRLPGCPAGCA